MALVELLKLAVVDKLGNYSMWEFVDEALQDLGWEDYSRLAMWPEKDLVDCCKWLEEQSLMMEL